MNNIPPGLKILQGERQNEETTLQVLDECCESHPNGCGRYSKECKNIFQLRACGDGRYGGWNWSLKIYKSPAPPRYTDEQRYCGTIQTVSRRMLNNRIREGVIGGMR